MRPGITSPWSRILSALINWLRKKAARRPSQASVASASIDVVAAGVGAEIALKPPNPGDRRHVDAIALGHPGK